MANGIHKLTLFVVAALILGSVSSCFAQQKSADRPNIIFILNDDHRWDALGCAGNSIIQTPEMDRLAKSGVRFSHAFITTPICAASRASFFTGQYERQHGYTFQQPPIAESLVNDSYPAVLRKSGYQTGFVGKFGVKIPKGASDKMFDYYRPTGLPYQKKDRDHLTKRNADLAIDFIRTADAGTPFCLSLSFWAPHAEDSNPAQFVPKPELEALYQDDTVPAAPLSENAFFEALPDFQKQSLNRVRWAWRFDNPEKYQEMVKGYYRMISGIDQAIGRIRKELDARGLADNTVIIVTGDNGYFLGERGFAGKWTMHDVSLRVPLIVYDPRNSDEQKGVVSADLVINLDVPTTILDYADAKIPETYQGKSLRPNVQQGVALDRELVFTEHLWNRKDIPRTEAIRTERWKYIRYLDHPEFEELYDLQNDASEMTNLAKSEEYLDLLKELQAKCTSEAERIASEVGRD